MVRSQRSSFCWRMRIIELFIHWLLYLIHTCTKSVNVQPQQILTINTKAVCGANNIFRTSVYSIKYRLSVLLCYSCFPRYISILFAYGNMCTLLVPASHKISTCVIFVSATNCLIQNIQLHRARPLFTKRHSLSWSWNWPPPPSWAPSNFLPTEGLWVSLEGYDSWSCLKWSTS
jgi:hypothetical protein